MSPPGRVLARQPVKTETALHRCLTCKQVRESGRGLSNPDSLGLTWGSREQGKNLVPTLDEASVRGLWFFWQKDVTM